jgi:hypothetical protein
MAVHAREFDLYQNIIEKRSRKMERLFYVNFWLVFGIFAAFIAGVVLTIKYRLKTGSSIRMITWCLLLACLLLGGYRFQSVRDTIDDDIRYDSLSCRLTGGATMPGPGGLEYWYLVGHAFVYMRFNEHGVPQREKGVTIMVCPDGTRVTTIQY